MAEEIGVAYLAVKPKVDGSFESELSASGNKGGKKFGGAFGVAAGNLMSSAVEKLAGGAADVFKNAFDNYADAEQLVGGVDTLFKGSSGKVQKNAEKAFESAGMSANEYMASVTGFAASMINSLGGDTDKAADYAQTAIVDMSDNANKMGTSMDELQRAYQSMARGNYGMLDSLKLGYGGTKSEMERMLADAEKISGVHYELGNFADVTQAIHVMQTEMGIAGTTAEEGSSTISGSITKLGATWQNFLTGVFDENSDLGVLGENLFGAIGGVLSNVLPRIGVLISTMVTRLPTAIGTALMQLPTMLQPMIMQVFGQQVGGEIMNTLNGAFGGFGEMMQKVGTAVSGLFSSMYGVVSPIIGLIAKAVQTAMPLIQQAVGIVVTFVTEKVLPTISGVLDTFKPVIQTIATSISDKMPKIQEIISKAMTAVKSIIDTVWPYVKGIIQGAVGAISKVISIAWPAISTVIDTAMGVISGVIDKGWPLIQSVIEGVLTVLGGEDGEGGIVSKIWGGIQGVIETVVGAISGAIEGLADIIDTVGDIFEGIADAISDPIGTAQEVIEDFVDDITGVLEALDFSLPDIALPHFSIWGGEFPFGIGGEGSLPEFSVNWYAKGGFVDGATLIGAGERGPEMILPRQGALMDSFADSIARRVGGGVDIHDCTFNVRKDSDIRAIAQELNTLINRQTVGGYA